MKKNEFVEGDSVTLRVKHKKGETFNIDCKIAAFGEYKGRVYVKHSDWPDGFPHKYRPAWISDLTFISREPVEKKNRKGRAA